MMSDLGAIVVVVVFVGFVLLALSGRPAKGQARPNGKKRRGKVAVFPGPDKDTVFVQQPGSHYAVAMKRSDAIAAGLIKPEPTRKRNFWKAYS